MDYKKIFDPDRVPRSLPDKPPDSLVDRRDGRVYVYHNPDVPLAVNIALATRRPLLLRGRSGTGKSSLARNVAINLGFRYYEAVVTSRTHARDLLWEVDLLRRLHRAQLHEGEVDPDLTAFIEPKVLWWAFDPASAGKQAEAAAGKKVADPTLENPGEARAVVLIDEIDKAEPDVPNNLLVPLGSLQFQVEETHERVKTTPETAPLVFITSNDERDLPPAFLRRCIQLELPSPNIEGLKKIAEAHFPGFTDTIAEIATLLQQATKKAGRPLPAPPEFLDTVRACWQMNIAPGTEEWKSLIQITVLKWK
jgi:MoxR-like ATPase